jgi:hypothetical protein
MAKTITTTVARTFNLKDAGAAVKSPVQLRDWLDKNIPLLVGPAISSVEPQTAHRDAILTIQGARFSTNRADNAVTVGGVAAPVLAAAATELKVLVARNANTGPIKVTVGGRTATAPHDFVLKAYPGAGEDGPPVFAEGEGQGAAGDANPIGTLKVLVVICQAKDLVPPNIATIRNGLDDRWKSVQKYYKQASYTLTDVQYDIVGDAAQLNGNIADFVDPSPDVDNIINDKLEQIAAIAAKHAQDKGFDLNTYTMMCCVVYTAGDFVRAWGNVARQIFSYNDMLPAGNPAHIDPISITLTKEVNLLWINENADWGRFAHEFGHNVVSAPTASGDGTATLGEDVYDSDLVDGGAATAQEFELMGDHDTHPLFSGYHLQKLGYYTTATNIREIPWDRNPNSGEVEIVAHGLTQNTDPTRVHILKIKISDALSYFVEVRQRPETTDQTFDENIPIGAAPHQGGVIVTRVIADEMHNNQQTRFITLMHDQRVLLQGETVEDPARTIKLTVKNDAVQNHPLICRVRYEWAQGVVDDPSGAFDLNVTPWDGNYQSPDIWIDRDPIGAFDNPLDAQGRPTGNGDKPWVSHINQFTARVNATGAMGASNVKVTFYAVTPPGVGDNGNWAPIDVKTIASIPANGSKDIACNWVPVVGQHTCLKVFASQQLGEISGGNNGAQENVFDFQAAGSSPVDPIFIKTAVRNPLDEPTTVYLTTKGLPKGYAAQIPHSWLRMGARAERIIDVMVWPLGDTSVYKIGADKDRNKEKRFVGTASFRVAGHIPRSYAEHMKTGKKHPPGSRFYPIGGTFYRVSVRKRATIRLEVDEQVKAKDSIGVKGSVQPVSTGQRILIDVLLPDGKTRRTAEVLTKSTGAFNARIAIADDSKKLQAGTYKVQALIFHASELADAESNILFVKR